jgi:hypothetical protein
MPPRMESYWRQRPGSSTPPVGAALNAAPTGLAASGLSLRIRVMRMGCFYFPPHLGTAVLKNPASLDFREVVLFERDTIYGVSRVRSRGNVVVNRMLGAPVSCMSRRSRPMANPPCGGIP